MNNLGFVITDNGAEIIKDTLETLDYNIDWAIRLADFGASIATSTWEVPTGIDISTPAAAVAGDITTIFLSGGSTRQGAKYVIRNTITTNGPDPRILIKSFTIIMVLR